MRAAPIHAGAVAALLERTKTAVDPRRHEPADLGARDDVEHTIARHATGKGAECPPQVEGVDKFLQLLRGIARFCAKDNVLTYLVCPGIIQTDQSDGFVRHYGLEEAVREIPLGELGKPEDVANVVVFLASGKARYSTGATIDVVGASFLH